MARRVGQREVGTERNAFVTAEIEEEEEGGDDDDDDDEDDG